MLDTKVTQKIFPILVLPSTSRHDGLDRLLAAAAINAQFCRLLLEDPLRAIREGFQGEDFQLSREELALLLSASADSLAGLASQFARAFAEQQTAVM